MTGRVTLEVHDAVAWVTLESPETRNALTSEMAAELVTHCEQIDTDATVGSAIIRGSQGQFCSGAHLDTLSRIGIDPAEPSNYRDHGATYEAFHRFGRLEVPTVAAVRGSAVGAGVNLMLAADLRLIAEDAQVLSGFLRIGIHPGGGHAWLLSRLAGPQTAAAMSTFGEAVDGRRASELGLVWEALPDDEVEKRAETMAVRAARDPVLAREAISTLRSTTHPPGVPWSIALATERAPQMRTLRARSGS